MSDSKVYFNMLNSQYQEISSYFDILKSEISNMNKKNIRKLKSEINELLDEIVIFSKDHKDYDNKEYLNIQAKIFFVFSKHIQTLFNSYSSEYALAIREQKIKLFSAFKKYVLKKNNTKCIDLNVLLLDKKIDKILCDATNINNICFFDILKETDNIIAENTNQKILIIYSFGTFLLKAFQEAHKCDDKSLKNKMFDILECHFFSYITLFKDIFDIK